MPEQAIKIFDCQPEHYESFKNLNYEWIEKYFVIEAMDRKTLENPEEYILKPGGAILMAEYEGDVVGTCALIKISQGVYELAKMAVTDRAKGKQIGYLLGEAILKRAGELQARKVFLVSNRTLSPALNLYKKLGFVEVPIESTEYQRADIKMEIDF